MQLYLIRHAQSFNNALSAEYASQRHFDPPLTELGRQQAQRLAEHLAQTNPSAPAPAGDPQNRQGYGLTHLYASLMMRAIATGAVVAERLGLPLHAWPDWHEEGGLYLDDEHGAQVGQAGPSRSDFARDYPGLVLPDTLADGGWWSRPYEAEAGRPERGRRVLAQLMAEHGATEHNVAVITHGGFYNHFIGALLNLLPPYPLTYLTNNTSISRLSIGPSLRYVVYHNHCEHLPAEMITY
jgi:2,3-bisphosphoglycerate-dependent phosphoglycerate mutase